MKAAIITVWDRFDDNCLIDLVAVHIKMLLGANMSVKLLANEDYIVTAINNNELFLDERIEWENISHIYKDNQIKFDNCDKYTGSAGQVPDTFFDEVDRISENIKNCLLNVDVCFVYDILNNPRYLVYNVAIREAQKCLSEIRFIAYVHSEPINSPAKLIWPFSAMFTPLPNTVYVYPTFCGLPALMRQFNIPEERCRVVNNSFDILELMSEETKIVLSKIDLLSPDILMIYPARLTPGKKFDKVTAFAAAIKNKTDKSVKIVFCDLPSSDINPELYKALIRRVGCALNLNNDDMVFTSDLGFKNGFPRSGVFDLLSLSNLFVCPSFSESFGLIALEAASRGNFLVLNEKVPALEELGNHLYSYFMRWDARNFGFDTKEDYYPSEQAYLEEQAITVEKLMKGNPVIHAKTRVRQNYSLEWIWENQLAPILRT